MYLGVQGECAKVGQQAAGCAVQVSAAHIRCHRDLLLQYIFFMSFFSQYHVLYATTNRNLLNVHYEP